MNKEFIYYHCNDIDTDGALEVEIAQDLRDQYEKLGFRIHEPKSAVEFLDILLRIPHEDTTLHIHAHGDGIQISPITAAQKQKFEERGYEFEFDSVVVSHAQIQEALQGIYPAHRLIINMMAVCYSASLPVIASTLFMGTTSANNDLQESFDVYDVEETRYKGQIEILNARRRQQLYVALTEEEQQ